MGRDKFKILLIKMLKIWHQKMIKIDAQKWVL
jgi:hypothetical protein